MLENEITILLIKPNLPFYKNTTKKNAKIKPKSNRNINVSQKFIQHVREGSIFLFHFLKGNYTLNLYMVVKEINEIQKIISALIKHYK